MLRCAQCKELDISLSITGIAAVVKIEDGKGDMSKFVFRGPREFNLISLAFGQFVLLRKRASFDALEFSRLYKKIDSELKVPLPEEKFA